MPQCPKGKLWTEPEMETQAFAALDRSMKEFDGDSERIYLTGISMGGYGTWDLAAKYPHRFAAYVPICGGIYGLPNFKQIEVSLAKDAQVADPYAETARRVGNTPAGFFTAMRMIPCRWTNRARCTLRYKQPGPKPSTQSTPA